jgi:hypothetical protein
LQDSSNVAPTWLTKVPQIYATSSIVNTLFTDTEIVRFHRLHSLLVDSFENGRPIEPGIFLETKAGDYYERLDVAT